MILGKERQGIERRGEGGKGDEERKETRRKMEDLNMNKRGYLRVREDKRAWIAKG